MDMFVKEEGSNQTSSVKITDVNIDCLEHVFEQLNIDSLMIIADTNNWLKTGAIRVFIHQFSKKTVILDNIYMNKFGISHSSSQIVVRDFEKCLKFLRNFGHLIAKLHISYLFVDKRYQTHVNQYINEYCTNLIEISFLSCSENMIDIRKTFTNVRKVRFVNCNLGYEMCRFNECFPNLRSLEFEGFNEIADPKCIAVQLPHLEHLATSISMEGKYGFEEKSMTDAAMLNPNLKSLHVHWYSEKYILSSMNEQLKSLESLKIDCFYDTFLQDPSDNRLIHFKRVNDFQLLLNAKIFSNYNGLHIPFQFDALKSFAFHTDIKIEDFFFDFIERHPTITKILVKGICRVGSITFDQKQQDRIADVVPSLIEFDVILEFTDQQALHFISRMKNLRKFNFKMEYRNSFDKMMENLPGWLGTMDVTHYVRLNRV